MYMKRTIFQFAVYRSTEIRGIIPQQDDDANGRQPDHTFQRLELSDEHHAIQWSADEHHEIQWYADGYTRPASGVPDREMFFKFQVRSKHIQSVFEYRGRGQ